MSWRKYVSASQTASQRTPFTSSQIGSFNSSQVGPYSSSQNAFSNSQTSLFTTHSQPDNASSFSQRSSNGVNKFSTSQFSLRKTSPSQPVSDLIHITNQNQRDRENQQRLLAQLPSKDDFSNLENICEKRFVKIENKIEESHKETILRVNKLEAMMEHLQNQLNGTMSVLSENSHVDYSKQSIDVQNVGNQIFDKLDLIGREIYKVRSNVALSVQESNQKALILQEGMFKEFYNEQMKMNTNMEKMQHEFTQKMSENANIYLMKEEEKNNEKTNIIQETPKLEHLPVRCASDTSDNSQDQRASAMVNQLKKQIEKKCEVQENDDMFDMFEDVFAFEQNTPDTHVRNHRATRTVAPPRKRRRRR
ncbi:hypothetical protein P9112_003840 [Eukaryota sp. TZLM1-RC]